MERKRFGTRYEDLAMLVRRVYCDRKCMAAAMMKPDDQMTRRGLLCRIRRSGLKAAQCESCGTTSRLSIHHRDRNWRNNDASNLATLCSSCHTRLHHSLGHIQYPPKTLCTICGEPASRRGMCQKHWQRFAKYGDPCLSKTNRTGRFVLERVE